MDARSLRKLRWQFLSLSQSLKPTSEWYSLTSTSSLTDSNGSRSIPMLYFKIRLTITVLPLPVVNYPFRTMSWSRKPHFKSENLRWRNGEHDIQANDSSLPLRYSVSSPKNARFWRPRPTVMNKHGPNPNLQSASRMSGPLHKDILPNCKRSPHQSKRASKHISATHIRACDESWSIDAEFHQFKR
jgi:hypothetical protein